MDTSKMSMPRAIYWWNLLVTSAWCSPAGSRVELQYVPLERPARPPPPPTPELPPAPQDPPLGSSAGYFSDPERCSSALSEASTASWAEEMEGEGTRRGARLLQRLEDGLFSDLTLPGELGEECAVWRQKFPHLRVEGHAIPVPSGASVPKRADSPTAEEEEVFASHGSCSASAGDLPA